jgi:hypothetical protein
MPSSQQEEKTVTNSSIHQIQLPNPNPKMTKTYSSSVHSIPTITPSNPLSKNIGMCWAALTQQSPYTTSKLYSDIEEIRILEISWYELLSLLSNHHQSLNIGASALCTPAPKSIAATASDLTNQARLPARAQAEPTTAENSSPAKVIILSTV